MEKSMSIQILLACYNGEKYLAEQLDSLLQQSELNFEILIRDDGSSDQTLALLKDYQNRFPETIRLIPSNARLGVIGNFSALLEASSADYILFSDQDDVWLKDKVKLMVEALKKEEEKLGKSTPLLVHTDLTLIDSKKNILHPSFWQFVRLEPHKGKTLRRLLVQNTVTGCAMGINRALATLAAPFPKEVIMHDWWLALVAAIKGRILTLNKSTILYRQHENNTIGVKAPSIKRRFGNICKFLFNPSATLPEILAHERQAKALFTRFQENLDDESTEILRTLLRAPEMTILERKWAYLKWGFFRAQFSKNVAYLLQDRPF